jgi:hypothetical protein
MHPAQISTTLASLAGYLLYDAIAAVSSLGFKSIGLLAVKDARHSIGHLPGFWFDALSQSERLSLRQALQPFQQIAVHAPFMDAPLISYSRHVMP